MNSDRIQKSLNRLNGDRLIQGLIAQANARYILLHTSEGKENYPSYTIDDDRLNILALQYLNLGCCLAENQQLSNAMEPLEKGASILESVHGASSNHQSTSKYYGLIAALGYYVSFQYSKSYILIRRFESDTVISKLVRYFLLRDFSSLNIEIYKIIVDPIYTDENIANHVLEEGATKIHEITLAKALDGFVKYLWTGDEDLLENSRLLLRDLKEIAGLEDDPGIWWVARLLILISNGFAEASLWNSLKNHFDIDDPQVKNYIKSLVFQQPTGIYELFITQRNSLDKVLEDGSKGCIVSIPTSSGKTRIAEIAILKSIQDNPDCKILYIAPFRSLAFEVENSLEKVFENAGISVSHLYGGSMYSKLDELAIEDANVIIATPEKAKAILRGNQELISQIALAIIDEGHLLGADKRLIMNEVFYEELRFYLKRNSAKFLLLSAVLPNAEDLAEWLTESENTVFRQNWRPSDERLGILEWVKGAININWESLDKERSSFNMGFVVSQELPWVKRQIKPRFFPGNKNEAIAATAVKLQSFGPVLIFVGLKASVFVMARAYLKALGSEALDHPWKNSSDWRAFELACVETYGMKNEWLEFARKGILCHNGDLQADVRLPVERLMRSDKPLVIISTSTLGQGVNLGVSTVIFSTLYQSGELITARDFWNIAGRAGRAFIDHEGKILVAFENNGLKKSERDYQIKEVQKFFDKDKIDIASSGILSLIKALKNVAAQNSVDFDLLLQLITENKLEEIGERAEAVEGILDFIDDTLLSLLFENNPEGEIDVTWAEDFFLHSLAAIQAGRERRITNEQVTAFLTARIQGIAEKVGSNRSKWLSIVRSGIPLNSDLILEKRLSELIDLVQKYTNLGNSIDLYIELLKEIEVIIYDLPVFKDERNLFDVDNLELIRDRWLRGLSMSSILEINGGGDTVTKLYSYTLPWVLNGIAKKLRHIDFDDEGSYIEDLAIMVEAGLPSIMKVKIYQAGIRSRIAANEIGDLFDFDFFDKGISAFKKELIDEIEYYKKRVSDHSGEWLDLLTRNSDRRKIRLRSVGPFEYGEVHTKTKLLLAKMVNGKQYLVSTDLKHFHENTGSLNFESVCDIPGVEFRYSTKDKLWKLKNNNPYVQILKR